MLLGLDALATLNAALFYRVNKTAGLLFGPYLIWLSYATYLNYSIWQLNKEDGAPTASVEGTKKE